jgi:hypothetical protein
MAKRTVIDLQSGKEGVWFDFFYSKLNTDTMEIEYGEPIEGGPRAQIRNPAPFFQARAENRKTESIMVYNKKARKMEKVTSEKELTPAERKAENEDMIDYMIQNVEGFKLDGKIIKNTKKDKVDAMTVPIFSMFVNHCVEMLQEQSAKEEKEETKNS